MDEIDKCYICGLEIKAGELTDWSDGVFTHSNKDLCKKEFERLKQDLLEEIGEKFFYHSDIDGVTLKLNELQEFKDFKNEKFTSLTGGKDV